MSDRRKNPGFFFAPPPGGAAGFCPVLRLAHDYPVSPESRIYRKNRIGDHALHFFVEGRGVYELRNRRYAIAPGTLFLVRPGEGYSFRLDDGATVRMLNLHFDLEDSPAFAARFPCPDDTVGKRVLPPEWPVFRQFQAPEQYAERFSEILACAGRAGETERLRERGLLLELLAFLRETAAPRRTDRRAAAIDRLLARFAEEPARPWTLAECCAYSGLARSTLCAEFRCRTGVSIARWLCRERLQRARFALLYGNDPQKTIAVECGFADLHHFGRVFKSEYGISPGTFRKNSAISDESATIRTF